MLPNKKIKSIIEKLIDKKNQLIESIGIDNLECQKLGEKLKKYKYEMSEEKNILKMYGEHKSKIYTSKLNSFEEINWLNNVIDIPIHSFMLGNLGITYVLLGMICDEVSSFLVLDILIERRKT